MNEFQKSILAGIPDELPAPKPYDTSVSHAPKRKDILTPEEKRLALKNALRYFLKSIIKFWLKNLPKSLINTDVFICTGSVPTTKCTHVPLMSIPQNRNKRQQ